jgi:predicted nuclease with TOPRIM domain
MHPSFKEEVAARRQVEDELRAIEHERDALAQRVQHLEAELDRLKERSSV